MTEFQKGLYFHMSDAKAHAHAISPIGGTLDGAAVGLGLGMISLLFAYNSPPLLKYCLMWIPFSFASGLTLGTIWGRMRGY